MMAVGLPEPRLIHYAQGRSARHGSTFAATLEAHIVKTASGTVHPRRSRFTSTEVVYGVTDPDVTDLPEYGAVKGGGHLAILRNDPQAAAHLDEARDDILAFTAFPREVWRQVWVQQPAGYLELSRQPGL